MTPAFPSFSVPGEQEAMESIRKLYQLHHPTSRPQATLWDELLPAASLWAVVPEDFRQQWGAALSAREIDDEGYVATHQHASVAHPRGWPFPAWHQGAGSFGWHFTNRVQPPWAPPPAEDSRGWDLAGARDLGVDAEGWQLELSGGDCVITLPALDADAEQVPFVQVRWGLSAPAPIRAWLQWRHESDPPGRSSGRMRITELHPGTTSYAVLPVSRHPGWQGRIVEISIAIPSAPGGARLVIDGVFGTYDTRHNVNNSLFILGCGTYFRWTRDLDFLAANLNRMRLALRFNLVELQAAERLIVFTPWPGHSGRSGLERPNGGRRRPVPGEGIGNNYWDLLPFGGEDCYATIRHYLAARELAVLERAVIERPEWNLPRGPLSFEPEYLEAHADAVRAAGNERFWNAATGRFVACIDEHGRGHDYGYTFLNLEAVSYGFATREHAASIMEWIDARREVRGDTASQDIYFWRFAPRTSTRRNVDWYGWVWQAPGAIAWGDQVQDGGAVLGFSYHDLMARLRVLGPDSAWARLKEIAAWFSEVEAAGGYRTYYDGSRPGTLQGGGTAGGLGLDCEFFESVMVPRAVIEGFLGMQPTVQGLVIQPALPAGWPELEVANVQVQGQRLRVRATPEQIEVERLAGSEPLPEPFIITSGGVKIPLQPEGVQCLPAPGPGSGTASGARGRQMPD